MKAVTDTLGVARSNVVERLAGTRKTRGPQDLEGDDDLAAEIRALVVQRPSYGYRRIAALIWRERRVTGSDMVNAKRVYRSILTAASPTMRRENISEPYRNQPCVRSDGVNSTILNSAGLLLRRIYRKLASVHLMPSSRLAASGYDGYALPGGS